MRSDRDQRREAAPQAAALRYEAGTDRAPRVAA